MVKRIFKFRRWRPRVSPSDIHRKSWDATKKVERGLESIVSISLRLGTLVVLIALFVFLYRTLTDQRYVIKSFSVPQHLEENGFTGAVVATRINDEVKALKELAASAKTDSLQMSGALEPALEVAVMGIGFSLESITYHLRQIMGRPNPIIRGEVVRIDSTYTLTLRMTGFEPIQREVNIALAGGEGPAVRRLMRIGGEAVMRNADPYRLALVYYREKDYESALSTIRYIIRERPGELHWAYHAWGIILEAQGKKEEALERLRQATRANPDFNMGWRRQAYLLNQLQRYEEARSVYQKSMATGSLTPQSWLNYGWFLHSQQMYEKADSAFEQATRMAPKDSRVWLAWVDSKVSRNDHQAAEALLDKIDILLQENAEGYLYRGLISFVKADTAAAIEHVQTAYQLDPSNEATVKMMMQGAFVTQDYERIIQVFEQTNWLEISESIRQSAWNMTAMSYNMLQRHESARDLIRRAIAINSTIAYPYTTLAETFAFTGQYDSCYHYFEKALQMGFHPESFNLDMPPYPVLKEQQPFQNLLERYGKLKD